MRYKDHKIRARAGCMAFIALACVLSSPVSAQTGRDKYIIVEAQNLKDNPQRYWSRGVVFTDILESVGKDRKTLADEKYVPVRTATLGTVYLKEALLERASALQENAPYIFAGTMRSEMNRRWFGRSKARYWVTVEAIEAPPTDETVSLVTLFESDMQDRPAFKNVRVMVEQAQSLLLAQARNANVDAADLFDPDAHLMDKAAEASRTAVRTMEQDLGIASSEILAQLVREILAVQYGDAATEALPQPAESRLEPVVDEPAGNGETESGVDEVVAPDAPASEPRANEDRIDIN